MTPTNINIANFYNVSLRTITYYKKGDEGKRRLYEAMKEYYIKEMGK